MKDLKNRKTLFAVMMLLALFAGCKGEDPTAPPPSSGPGTGGGTPPVGASITLAVANPNPLANSSTTITATVTEGGQPVPNGTAVEFGTTFGLFTDTGTNLTIKTTTNGQATATLSATSGGTANVTAVVNNAIARTTVTFQASGPTTPPPDTTAPTISSVTPTSGRPEGGDLVTITGRNFRTPVRVFFDVGGGRLIEGAVASVTATQIQVLTPRVDLGAGQTLASTVVLINEAGTPSETRVTGGAFTFRKDTLTPVIRGVSPTAGPLEGGTRVTIFGDAFESPAQVFFGRALATIINVTFSQIIAVSPPARDASDDGTAPVIGPVAIRVRNIASGTEATINEFRYVPGVVVTALGPNQGPYTGGTRITIDGSGFDDPLTVTTAGIAASIIRVSGTQIVAITNGVQPTGCNDVVGPTIVTNINTGASGTGPEFIYRVLKPSIILIAPANPADPTINPGESIIVTGFNLENVNSIEVGGRTLFITSRVINPDGTITLTVVLPLTGFTFPSGPCVGPGGAIGTAPQPLTVSVTVADTVTTCTTTANNALTIEPTTSTCTVPGPARAVVTQPGGGACSNAGNVVAAGTATGTATVIVANTAPAGSQSLQLTASVTAGQTDFSVAPATATVAPAASQSFTVTFDPQAVGARAGTLTFTTNDPANPTLTVCLQGNGT